MASKSLHRMLAPRGNPSTENFFGIGSVLQKKTREIARDGQNRVKVVDEIGYAHCTLEPKLLDPELEQRAED